MRLLGSAISGTRCFVVTMADLGRSSPRNQQALAQVRPHHDVINLCIVVVFVLEIMGGRAMRVLERWLP